MTKFQTVKKYYDSGLWSLSRVRDAVAKGWISEAEYEEITERTLESEENK